MVCEVLLVVAALLCWGAIVPEAWSATRGQIDAVASPAVEDGGCAGLVVGVIDANGRRVVGYGRVRDDRADRPDGQTVFEIGSVTKVFTATLLARMIEQGVVRLDQPVRESLPANVKVPARDGREI